MTTTAIKSKAPGVIVSAVALLVTASTLFAPATAMAQDKRQKDKNNMRNLGVGLGGAAAVEILRGQTVPGLVLGAGAVYAGKKYEDQRKAQNKDNQDKPLYRRYRYRNGHRIGYYLYRGNQRLSYHSLNS